jgi:hypothetical protein
MEETLKNNETAQLGIGAVMCWALISNNDFPKDKWLIIETSDKAHHIAYFSGRYEKWEANSKFGGEPKWWAEVPSAPCTIVSQLHDVA